MKAGVRTRNESLQHIRQCERSSDGDNHETEAEPAVVDSEEDADRHHDDRNQQNEIPCRWNANGSGCQLLQRPLECRTEPRQISPMHLQVEAIGRYELNQQQQSREYPAAHNKDL